MKFNAQKKLENAERAFKRGDLKEAKRLYQSALKESPNSKYVQERLKVINNSQKIPTSQASLSREKIEIVFALYSKGKIQEAIDAIKVLNKDYPNVPILFNLIGACYKSIRQFELAIKMFESAIKIKPDYAEAHYNLGVIFKDLGNLNDAIECFKKAIKHIPNYPDAYNNLGNAQGDLGLLDEAIESYEWALAYKPDYAQAYLNLAILYSKHDQNKAISFYKKAITSNPNYAAAYFNLASTYRHLGLKDEAIKAYEKAIEIKPDYVDAHKNLSAMKKYKKSDPQIAKMERLLKSDLSASGQVSLNFALAKVNEDLENQDEFFKFLNKGNYLRKKELDYTFSKDKEVILKIKEVFKTPLDKVKKSSLKAATIKPIFIVGMPRSGTSLVEQIISSHHSVHGAGELDFLAKIIGPRLKEFSVDSNNVFTNKDVLSIRQKYLDSLSSFSTSENFITDKMPLNFRFIGFILSAFPDAKIVHLNRDARATCWSIYKHYFKSNGNGYAHNFEDLAAYFSLYKDLMDFWHESNPNKIYDICYEDLTTNQEQETRRLLEYCGLEWDKSCLNFHTNTRAVKTTSALQVREKMYQGSSDAWKKYENYLTPLIKGLSSF